MISDERGKQLHDKATRGQRLSVEEQARLDNWYAIQDAAEQRALNLASDERTAILLQEQIDTTLAQLITVTQQIQKVSAENDSLRQEITLLRRRMAHLLLPA